VDLEKRGMCGQYRGASGYSIRGTKKTRKGDSKKSRGEETTLDSHAKKKRVDRKRRGLQITRHGSERGGKGQAFLFIVAL